MKRVFITLFFIYKSFINIYITYINENMKIIIKEISADRNNLLIYLMTNDDVPVRCEITTRNNANEVIKRFSPCDKTELQTITYNYPKNILRDE